MHVCSPFRLSLNISLPDLTLSDNQAFGRVFRIGQDKETHFVKMVVQETVDERLLLTCKSFFKFFTELC